MHKHIPRGEDDGNLSNILLWILLLKHLNCSRVYYFLNRILLTIFFLGGPESIFINRKVHLICVEIVFQ